MDQVGRLSTEERASVFLESASRLGIASPVILEKDYWVCWSLSKLFELEALSGLVFKGGTSLSKAYALIKRFSEDVDLTIPLSALGIPPLPPETSKKGRVRYFETAKARCAEMLAGPVREALYAKARDADIQGEFDILVDSDDPLTLVLRYPRALSDREYGAGGYIQPSVQLEFGLRGGVEPSAIREIEAYCIQAMPQVFDGSKVPVRVLGAERTLWEKATICHATYHGGPDRPLHQLSRHYSDLAALSTSDVAEVALAQPDLLATVVENTRANFPIGWARYEEATPSGIRIVPHPDLGKRLREDYEKMSVMFFEPPPDFEGVVGVLESFESRVRGLSDRQNGDPGSQRPG